MRREGHADSDDWPDVLVYPQIYSTDLDDLRLLAIFGECQVIAQTVARRFLVVSLITEDF